MGGEGLNGGIGVAFLWKTESTPDPISLQAIGGTGMQYSGSIAGLFGGSVSYNTKPNNLLRPASYISVGANVGIGVATPVSGSAQITVSQPLLMFDYNKGFYLGKGKGP